MTEGVKSGNGFTEGHVSEATLIDLNLNDSSADVGAEHRDHVRDCDRCQESLSELQRIVAALHAPITLEQPPPSLWDRISEDLQHQNAGDAVVPVDPEEATVTPLRTPRSRAVAGRAPWWVVIAAAAAGALLGGAAIAALYSVFTSEGEPPAIATSIGGAELEPVAADDFYGSAEMVQRQDGGLELTVEISGAADPSEGYFEIWLRDEDATRLISLGAVTETTTTLQVPVGVDLSEYPVVDVSHEHFDGDPSHSGVTLAAGLMETDAS